MEAPADNAPYVEWAIHYARKNIPVFPLAPQTKIPLKDSKGVDDATTDEEQIRSWWKKYPNANIGAACGHKFDVLDVDKGGAQEFEKHDDKRKVTCATRTVKGGTHIFYAPSLVPLKNGVRCLPGLDVRTKGGYVVMPPSFVYDEKENIEAHYKWREGMALNGQALPEVPMWVVKAFKQGAKQEASKLPDRIHEGEGRQSSLFSLGCSLRRKGCGETEIRSAIDAVNQARCIPPLDQKEIDHTVKNCLKYQPEANTYELPPRGMRRVPGPGIEAPQRRILRKASEIEEEDVNWLLYPYLPKGMPVGCEGQPGIGKTYALLALASALSRGTKAPWMEEAPALGNTCFWSLDDSVKHTLKKRVNRMGGDLDRILLEDGELVLDISGLQEIRDLITAYDISWFVLDPLAKFIDPVLKRPRPELSLSEIMTELKRIAEETGCTITPNRHLRKGRSGNPIDDGFGGIEIIGGYRSALRVDRDPDQPFRAGSSFGVVSHIKNNVGPIGHAFGYEIQKVDRDTADFFWTGARDFDPSMAPAQEAETVEHKDARDFLLHELQTGRSEYATVLETQALKQGISKKQLRRAREALCEVPQRIGFGSEAKVFWKLKSQFVKEDPYA